ncbi:MAG: OsmC family protein [Marinicaulis sp.]|nr:OsmC family protein [Marinicaulis sp.]
MDGETRKAEFEGATGEKLAAALEMPVGEPRAYALFAHCFTCSKDIKAAREIARALRREGFAVLRFDFTGLGGSHGDFANTNFSSNVGDLLKAASFLRSEFEAPSILIGHSLGGAAVLSAASEIDEVKGVAVIGAPSSAEHITMQFDSARDKIEKEGVAEVSLAGRQFSITKQFLDDVSGQNVLDRVMALKKPLLVMHAPLDQTVGIENATEIFVAAKHPKSFVSLDTADHLLSNSKDAQYAASVLAAWASRFLDGGGTKNNLSERAPQTRTVKGGAVATNIDGEDLAVSLSIDGHPMVIDASKADGGSNLGPNPTRTVEAALAACGVMTIKMYARRKGWDVGDIEISVKRGESEDPHSPYLLEKTVSISGNLDDDQRNRVLEIADKCPVHKMLAHGVTVNSRID